MRYLRIRRVAPSISAARVWLKVVDITMAGDVGTCGMTRGGFVCRAP